MLGGFQFANWYLLALFHTKIGVQFALMTWLNVNATSAPRLSLALYPSAVVVHGEI